VTVFEIVCSNGTWKSTTKQVTFECCSSALPQQCLLDIKATNAQHH